jgi:TolA-binding protein
MAIGCRPWKPSWRGYEPTRIGGCGRWKAVAAPAWTTAHRQTTNRPRKSLPTSRPAPLVSRPKVETRRVPPPTTAVTSAKPGDANFQAGGEEAYDRGYNLWNSGRYDEAITALRAMASSFPGHRRVSWANNLVGRALLDKGQPRAAAEALLANYRSNPKGERAPDSLFYLGQALVKLGQAAQACKAYGELQDVYGSTMRAQLQQQLQAARAAAKCG